MLSGVALRSIKIKGEMKMPPYCEKHQQHYEMVYENGMAWKTCVCTACDFEKVSGFSLLPQAPETTASPSETAADKGILTEEELKEITWPIEKDDVYRLINSHRELIKSNAELSFKNNEQRKTIDHQHILLDKYEAKLNGGI